MLATWKGAGGRDSGQCRGAGRGGSGGGGCRATVGIGCGCGQTRSSGGIGDGLGSKLCCWSNCCRTGTRLGSALAERSAAQIILETVLDYDNDEQGSELESRLLPQGKGLPSLEDLCHSMLVAQTLRWHFAAPVPTLHVSKCSDGIETTFS